MLSQAQLILCNKASVLQHKEQGLSFNLAVNQPGEKATIHSPAAPQVNYATNNSLFPETSATSTSFSTEQPSTPSFSIAHDSRPQTPGHL